MKLFSFRPLVSLFVAFLFTLLPSLVSAANVAFDEVRLVGTHGTFPVVVINGTEYSFSGTKYDRTYGGMGGPTTVYQEPSASLISALTTEQRVRIAHACERTGLYSGTACEDLYAADAETREGLEELRDAAAYEEAGGVALTLFNFAMGQTAAGETTSTCISCSFLGAFMLALSRFSYASYIYFEAAFRLFVPILMATWMAWKAIPLFYSGGENGLAFISSVMKRMALFIFVWLIVVMGNETRTLETGDGWVANLGVQIDNPKWAWDTVGPKYLTYAFGLSSEVRNGTIQAESSISTYSAGASYQTFTCENTVETIAAQASDPIVASFAQEATELACVIERTSMIGISSALAVIGSAQAQVGYMPSSLAAFFVKGAAGFFMLAVFGIMVIWQLFLILDVVVRGLITAAVFPVIAGMYLFEATRPMATRAMKALAGALATSVSLGIVSTLGYFLLTNTVNFYNLAIPSMDGVYGIELQPILMSDPLDAFREFIVRIQESDSSKPQIPMGFSAPWFYYLILTALALFSLGKKIIAMLEGIFDTSGSSMMADTAVQTTKSAVPFAQRGAAMAAVPLLLPAKLGADYMKKNVFGSSSGGDSAGLAEKMNPFGNSVGMMEG